MPGRRLPPALVLATLLLLALAPTGRSLADEDDPDLAGRKEELLLRLRVQHAIDRGLVWLLSCQDEDGSFRLSGNPMQGPFLQSRHRFGETALALLTLAHGGYRPGRREVDAAVAWLRRHHRAYLHGEAWPQASAYGLSLLVVALHELYARDPEAISEEDLGRYGSSVLNRRNPCGYPPWVRQLMDEVITWLLEGRAAEGLFRYPGGLPGPQPTTGSAGLPGQPARGPHFGGPEDLSNTQYVLLALWAGTRCGYLVDPEVLSGVARRLLVVQETSGPEAARAEDPPPPPPPGTTVAPPVAPTRDRARGFGYTPGDEATGSMTAAGLSSLAIVKAMLQEQHALDPELGRALDQGMWDAIAWLALHYDLSQNPPRFGPLWHHYYLYGLERALVIVGKERLGPHDWYREGARRLVDAQEADGAWRPPSPLVGFGGPPGASTPYDTAMIDTCFAILFLHRAALLPRQPVLPRTVVTPGDGTVGTATPRGDDPPRAP